MGRVRLLIPLSHLSPYVPLSQPFGQFPFMWSHGCPFRQFPQISIHLSPYVLSLHSLTQKRENIYLSFCTSKVFFSHKVYLNKYEWTGWMNELTFITFLPGVSQNTTQTGSLDYVTVPFLTVLRACLRTIFSIKPRCWTTCWKIIQLWILFTMYNDILHKTRPLVFFIQQMCQL